MSDQSEDVVRGVVVVFLVCSCFISSAIASVVKSCEPSYEARCARACGPRGVQRATDTACECRGAP
jgi:hypothetical protein